MRACDLRCESSVPTLPGEGPLAIQGTVEQEYLHTLLQDLLDTGNLTPAELDWASSRLHGWSKHLRLEHRSTPRPAAFTSTSRAPRDWHASTVRPKGAKIGYLDSTPLMLAIEHSIAALREPGPDGGTRPDIVKQQRIAILEKIRPVFSPSRHADLRRHARVAVDLPVDIRVGLSRITRALASPEPPQRANAAVAVTRNIRRDGPPHARGASRFFTRLPPTPRRSSCCRLPAIRGRPTRTSSPQRRRPPLTTRNRTRNGG